MLPSNAGAALVQVDEAQRAKHDMAEDLHVEHLACVARLDGGAGVFRRGSGIDLLPEMATRRN